MLNNIRRVMNMLIFILLAPLVGYEEASREIARGGRREDKALLVAIENISRGVRKRSIEYDLVEAARCYEYSGMGHDTYFEYLYTYIMLKFEDLRRTLSEYYIAVLTGSVGVSLASIILLMLGGPGPALLVYAATVIIMFILVHQVQPQIAEYRYVKPVLTALSVLGIAYIFKMPLEVDIIASCICASLFVMPSVIETFRMLLYSQTRLILPFLELLWNATPTPIHGRTLLEKELSRLWEYGYNIGAPWFIARLCRLVMMLVHTVKYFVRTGLMYAPFVLGSYIILLLITKTVMMGLITVNTPLIHIVSKETLQVVLLAQGLLTGLLAGKVAHSAGLSAITIPIALTAKLVLVGPTLL